MKILKISGCDECPYYEMHKANGKIIGQFCYNLDTKIHKNEQMNHPENCPLEDDGT